jgi:hypothetical protein
MPKYYSLMLSPHISKTPEGYLICRDVNICRSGFQEYRGNELSRFPGYEHSWNLDPGQTYKVYRPKEEVLNPDTMASFEGKTVVNEHPDGDAVYIDNDGELNCGHIQGVHRGPDLPPSEDLPEGAVTLQGDLHVKDPELVEKIWPAGDPENGVRDISCGYSLRLKRLADGTLVMTHIRGNHVAVVEKGRAGSLIAIQDSAPQAKAEILVAICDSAPPEIKQQRRKIMTIKELIFGRGVKAMMPDASPEEVSAVLKDLEDDKNGHKPVAKDSLTKQDELASEHPHRVAAHAALDRCMDARGSADGMGKDAFGKPSHLNQLKKELLKFIEEEEAAEETKPPGEEGKPAPATAAPPPAAPPAEAAPPAKPEEEDAAPPEEAKPEIEELAEGEGAEAEAPPEEAGTAPPEEESEDRGPEGNEEPPEEGDEEEEEANDAEVTEKGESVLKQANDSVRAYIRATKPVIAAIVAKPKSKRSPKEVLMVDSYNRAVRGVNAAGPAYRVLAKVKVPPRIPALAVDAEKARTEAKAETDLIASFYEGVPWNKGKERHDLYLTTKGK